MQHCSCSSQASTSTPPAATMPQHSMRQPQQAALPCCSCCSVMVPVPWIPPLASAPCMQPAWGPAPSHQQQLVLRCYLLVYAWQLLHAASPSRRATKLARSQQVQCKPLLYLLQPTAKSRCRSSSLPSLHQLSSHIQRLPTLSRPIAQGSSIVRACTFWACTPFAPA